MFLMETDEQNRKESESKKKKGPGCELRLGLVQLPVQGARARNRKSG